MAPPDGAHAERVWDRGATDEGFSGGAAWAEEAAVHVIDGDPDVEGDREYPRQG